ncbi:hypothetical protein LINPERPRIM_LOCUS36910 [Linum perenne]
MRVTPEVVTIYARAFSWVLVGAVLLANRIGDHILAYLLPLIGDPDVVATFSWGSAVLAWLYRQMGGNPYSLVTVRWGLVNWPNSHCWFS